MPLDNSRRSWVHGSWAEPELLRAEGCEQSTIEVFVQFTELVLEGRPALCQPRVAQRPCHWPASQSSSSF